MSNEKLTPLLDSVDSPEDLRRLPLKSLPELCDEIREYLIDTVSKTSGHFASGLAVVELAAALHYVFNTPKDKLVWDVGHQAYPHKILTGHKKELSSIRHKGGLHSFIWRGETPYDLLSTGHASTSIGSALGMAVAERNLKTHNKVVAVIGDGALSGGAAYEAMNNAGSIEGIDLLVILNDNEMSISKNVGSIAKGLSTILANPHYVKLVKEGRKILKSFPAVHDFAMRAQEHVKGMVMPGTFFEELGFNYIGPVNGNDVKGLVSILNNVKNIGGLQFLHVITTKGKGYAPAEQDPISYHGVPAFDPKTGLKNKGQDEDLSFSAGFGSWLCHKAEQDPKTVGITPAMPVGSGMNDFARRFPDRFFDVGIAEQHAMIFASGLAAGGLHPVVNIYSSFLQRAYDGVIHDMAIQNLPILLAIDRGGVVGPDGPTHQGVYDLAFLRAVPNLIIMTPSSRKEQFMMLETGYRIGKPAVVRFPRCNGEILPADGFACGDLEIGKGTIKVRGFKVAILAFGPFACDLYELCLKRNVTLADMRFVKPLDESLILELAQTHETIVTIEDGVIAGGIGEEVCRIILSKSNLSCQVINLGIPDKFIYEASRQETMHDLGLDQTGVSRTLDALLR